MLSSTSSEMPRDEWYAKIMRWSLGLRRRWFFSNLWAVSERLRHVMAIVSKLAR
jgi:hypothetical protein